MLEQFATDDEAVKVIEIYLSPLLLRTRKACLPITCPSKMFTDSILAFRSFITITMSPELCGPKSRNQDPVRNRLPGYEDTPCGGVNNSLTSVARNFQVVSPHISKLFSHLQAGKALSIK